jgi:hypothetical protein
VSILPTETLFPAAEPALIDEQLFSNTPAQANDIVAKSPGGGPSSEEGKAVCSRNAVKHNLTSTRLSGADLEELNAIRARLDDEWTPRVETERILLQQMALSQRRIDRALSLELVAFNDETLDEKLLALALRYRTTAERLLFKSLAELQRLRAAMRNDAERELERERKLADLEMQQIIFQPVPRTERKKSVSQNTTSAPETVASPQARPSFESVLQNLGLPTVPPFDSPEEMHHFRDVIRQRIKELESSGNESK